ncbi:putative kinase [Cinnamomum micranthum f. kanehirae]|uniref:Putative kinase n=1 Tax=Cinnamomum micranthum f. kanehirae TaxID=337451 RepID=A0A443N6E3_9MAGN|nr:putative kinase [Cinnamomum micranthum f. kanehirae]
MVFQATTYLAIKAKHLMHANGVFDDCRVVVCPPDPNLRPSIKQTIQALKFQFEAAMPNIPNEMPVVMHSASPAPGHYNQPLITNSSIALSR